jgi:uncharacterized protein (DUF362 family)
VGAKKGRKSMSSKRKSRLMWILVLCAVSVLVLLDISNTIAQKQDRSVNPILIDLLDEPVPLENSVVGIVQSTDAGLANPQPLTADLSIAEVDAMTRLAVQRAGGLADVIQPGDWVTIKVNILRFRGQGGYNVGVATDLRVVRSLIQQLVEEGDADRISVVEGKQWRTEEGGWEAVYPEFGNLSYTGMLAELQAANTGVTIDYVDLDYPPYTNTPVPGGGLAQDYYQMPDAILNCDRLIAVPAMKTHTWTRVTLANKLYIGATPASFYNSGLYGGSWDHGNLPHGPLDRTICDLVSYHPADLSVVAGIWGIEGNGPAGSGTIRRNTILASTDIVAADAVSAAAMGFNPWDIDYLHLAHNKGFGIYDLDYITINGPALNAEGVTYNFAKPIHQDLDPGYAYGSYTGRCNRTWLVNGFHDEYGADLDYNYLVDPEADIAPVAGQSQGGRTWTIFSDIDDYMDLQSYFDGGATNGVTYAFTRILADQAMSVNLRFGSDDGIKIWLNGNLVYTNAETGTWSIIQQSVPVTLAAGENRLLVKIKNNTGAHGFSMAVSESDGDTPMGIRYSLTQTASPEIVLSSPMNGFQTNNSYMNLEVEVTDPDANDLTVRFYGGLNDPNPTALIGTVDTVESGSVVSYDWDAPLVPVDENTIALWHYDEYAGGIAYDAGPDEYDGVVRQAKWISRGKFGPCLYFDGLGNVNPAEEDYVLAPDTSRTTGRFRMDGMEQITLEAWIYVASELDEPYYGIFKKWGPNTNPELWSYAMVVMRNRTLYWHLITDRSNPWGTYGVTVITQTLVPLYEWVHVCGTYDGSRVRLFINGVPDPAANLPYADAVQNTPVGTHVGAAPYLEAQYFHGFIDEPRIMDRALTPEEISDRVRLRNGRYYWRAEVSDGVNVAQSEVRYFDIGTVLPPDPNPPEVTLISPDNGYNTTSNNVALSADVSDENPMTVRFYGNSTDASDLLYARENVSSGTVTYTWRNQIPQADVNTRSLWHFSEGGGTSTSDKTAYNNDGTLYGGAAWTTDARFGYALDFDGVDDYVEVADNGSVPLSGPMTVEAWIKPSSAPIQYSEIVDRELGAGGGYSFILNNDRLINFYVGDGTDWAFTLGTTPLQDDLWYYVVGVADGSTLRIYVNGVQEGTPVTQGAPTNTNPLALRIGRGCGALLRWFNGTIDEVRISNRALPPGEIAANFATGLPEGTYYWNVAASDGQNETASETRLFYIGAAAGPLIPTLISPANLAVIGDDTPTFTWSATAGTGGTYTLQYALDDAFTTGVETISGITEATYTVPDPDALADDTYYWHVQAFDSENNSRGYQATPFSFELASPTPPEIFLESPDNGAVTLNPYMNLDFTVTDPGETMTIWAYGDMTDASALLYVAENVASPADITYVWNAPALAVDANTMGYWRFNEGSGAAVADETPYNNDGTITGATWTTGGRLAYGLDFDGVNDYVEVPASASLNAAGPMTVEAWIRPSGTPLPYSEIVDKEGGSGGYSFILNNDRRLHLWVGDGTPWVNTVGTTSLQDNVWYYVVGVADGSDLRVYVNGVQEGTPTPQGAPGSTAGVNLRIGRMVGTGLRWFNGIIDEVRISNRALTPGEIAANYELGDGRYYWKVVASDGISTTTSETRYFDIGEPSGPPIPELLSPPDLAALSDGTPTFTWSATAGVGGTYTLEYALDDGFTTGVVTVADLADATYTVPDPDALVDDTYYWHVQAFDAGSETRGYQATPFSFTIDTTAPVITLDAPPDLATTMNPYMDLEFTVSDADAMTVWVYGDRDDASELLYVGEDVPSSSMLYSWTGFPHQLDADAVGLWHFNEGSGGSVSDETAYGNDGTLVNGASWASGGRFGYAVQFDGVDDAVVVPDAPELDGMSELTLEAWIYLAVDPTDWMAVVQKWAPQGSPSNQYTYTMVVSATNRLYMHIFTDEDDALLTGNLPIAVGAWTHVAATYDGSVIRLYVNGVEDPITANLTGTINSTDRDVNIGACLPYNDEYFNGMIDDVRILTRALTPEEIAADAGQLPLGAYYWRVAASDGANTATSDTWRFDIIGDTTPPEVTLNYPAHNATTIDRFMELSATATDLSLMTVKIYGDRVDASELLYVAENMASPADATYVWNAPMPTVDGNTAALWHFNEGAGAAAGDETAYNNDGTISGAAWTTDGRFGYGLDFDGVNDYVQVPDNVSLNITGPITIEAWIRPSGTPVQYSEIVDKEPASPVPAGPGYSFILNDNRRINFYVGESGTDWAVSAGWTALQDGVWYYVVGVETGDSIRVYVNGVQDGRATAQGPPGSTAGVNLQIGRGGSLLQRWFNGIIDEVRISDRALTPEEIAANYSLGDGRYYWKVVASHGSYSTTSATRAFTIGVPPVPALISPPDLEVIVDNTPTFTWSATAGVGGTYTLQLALDAGFTSVVKTVTGIGGATYTVPDPEALADNAYYWHVQAIDQWNNASGYQAVPFSFTVNAVAPGPPEDFAVGPGHNKCKLSWTNPSASDFAGVMIRRNPWNAAAYPEYEGTPLGYPAGPTDGEEVYVGTAESFEDAGMPRNVYYYTIFSFDNAGNYSAASPAVQGRATSYWLGDVDADGFVQTSDLVDFSSAFGSIQGGGGWNNICDFGPTEDWSRLGIPRPDDLVDFEDLMIFALNWGVVTPAGMDMFVAAHTSEDLSSLVKFEIVPGRENVLSVVLKNQAATLKGIHIVLEAEGDVLRVERGSLIAGRSDVFFGTLSNGKGTADICMAALGIDKPLLAKATGEIARFTVAPGEKPAVVRFKAIDLRNLDNKNTDVVVADKYEAPFVPKATALMQNFPNPFNPTTVLTYDVASAGQVTIQVFDVSGRLIRMLLDVHKEVGRHQVAWDGKDASGSAVPSGIYFYRMKTSGFDATRKMILLR